MVKKSEIFNNVDAGEPFIRVKNISKKFGSLKALSSVSLDFLLGEVHVILGENGAGKSTLINILAGIYSADSGDLEILGRKVNISSPQEAARIGVGVVYQNFRLVRRFTGRENIRLQTNHMTEYRKAKKFEARLRDTLSLIDLPVNLDVPIQELSIAEQQRIAILKALFLGAKVLILDEPTSVLTDDEASKIINLMRTLAKNGKSVVFISHKLREVSAAGDRISILRRGELVLGPTQVSNLTADDMSKAIVGGSDMSVPKNRKIYHGETALELSNVSFEINGKVILNDVCLKVAKGSIVGIAGVGGNGQKELAEIILGLKKPNHGSITVFSKDASRLSIRKRRALGMRYIPADRNNEALALNCTCNENLTSNIISNDMPLTKWVSKSEQKRIAYEKMEKIDVKGQKELGDQPVKYLSGGNLQKVVLSREMDAGAKILVFHSPTQGLDIAAQRSVWNSIVEAANSFAAILLISEDLEEILSLSERVLVMNSGRILSDAKNMPSRERIGQMILGHV